MHFSIFGGQGGPFQLVVYFFPYLEWNGINRFKKNRGANEPPDD